MEDNVTYQTHDQWKNGLKTFNGLQDFRQS